MLKQQQQAITKQKPIKTVQQKMLEIEMKRSKEFKALFKTDGVKREYLERLKNTESEHYISANVSNVNSTTDIRKKKKSNTSKKRPDIRNSANQNVISKENLKNSDYKSHRI